MSLIVYGVQLDSIWENKQANFAKVRALLAKTKPSPASLIVVPEMFATGFSCELSQTSEPLGGPTELFLREIAASYQCAVLGGVVTPGSDGKGRNQALAFAPDGTELVRYTKMRPFSMGGEADVHERGETPILFEWAGLKIAPLICYDLRFPELARQAVGLGAEVLAYIAAWPVKRQHHWVTLLKARAIENLAYVIGINRCGVEPHYTYAGRSLVVDPHGIVIADASEQECVFRAELAPNILRDWRTQFPPLRDAGLA